MGILKFQPFIPYTKDDYKRMDSLKKSAKKYFKWLRKQKFEVGDKVIFEGETCTILHILNDKCILQHKNHQEDHLLKYCKKIK